MSGRAGQQLSQVVSKPVQVTLQGRGKGVQPVRVANEVGHRLGEGHVLDPKGNDRNALTYRIRGARSPLTIGRRESCEISLPFPNISSRHCELSFSKEGFWTIRDLNSTNGVKVNGIRVQNRFLKPGDEINIAKRRYTIQYALPPGGLRG